MPLKAWKLSKRLLETSNGPFQSFSSLNLRVLSERLLVTGRHQGNRKGPFGQPERHQGGRKGLIGQLGQPGRHQGGTCGAPGRLLCYRCSERPLKAILCYEGHQKRIPCYERPVEEESVLRCPFEEDSVLRGPTRGAPSNGPSYESPKKRLLCEEGL